jgi:formylaminopyrimidine deformylase / aminopyrimidine aminohydrolase
MDWTSHPLINGAGELWREGTQSPFLDAIENGALPEEAFNRWLSQDYLFAKGLTSAQAVQASKTPRPSQKTVIAGLSAMDAELDWFESHLSQRGVRLNAEQHPVCRRYVDYLIASAYSRPPEVMMAVLFGVEAAYLAAWSSLKADGPYAEFIERWSNDAFREYVQRLGDHANQMNHPEAQTEFNRVMEHERDFWHMTWEG